MGCGTPTPLIYKNNMRTTTIYEKRTKMKKLLNTLLFILSFIWQLPQSLIGIIMLLFFRVFGYVKLISYRKLCFIYEAECMSGGISLGNFAIVSPKSAKRPEIIAHEQLGHTWDSKLMGPLYLFIVGIPSLLNAWFDFTDCYYDFYPERWSNKHAGLTVDEHCSLKFIENENDSQ